jgi:hypothetical protein
MVTGEKVKIKSTSLNTFFGLTGKTGKILKHLKNSSDTGRKQYAVKIGEETWWLYEDEIEDINEEMTKSKEQNLI